MHPSSPAAVACLVLVHILSRDPGLSAAPDLLEDIDAVVLETMEAQKIPGVSVGVRIGDEVLVARGYGLADVENEVPATERTVYRIGSVTKQFTAAAMMRLVEQGKVALEDPLTKFLPDYPTGGREVTVRHLLDHTSGIHSYTSTGAFWEHQREDVPRDEMVALISAEPFDFDPGERFAYNNSGYFLAGVVIEVVTGESYADYVRKTLFEPLGLRDTLYLYERPIVPRRAEGYEIHDGKIVNDDSLSMYLPYAAGSLGSTVVDLLEWQELLVEGKVVGTESYTRMTTPATLTDGSRTSYGFGLMLGRVEGFEKVSHGGGIHGFKSQLAYYPDPDLTVVVLCNSGAANPAAIEDRIARLVLGI